MFRILLRILLAAIFLVSGSMKLRDPLLFAFAVEAFHLGVPVSVVERTAYILPWLELLLGAALLVGFWTRPAAGLALTLMLAFILGIVSLGIRQLDVDCPCFGSLRLVCSGPLGLCHVLRNLVIGGAAAWLVWSGPGPWSIDARGSAGSIRA